MSSMFAAQFNVLQEYFVDVAITGRRLIHTSGLVSTESHGGVAVAFCWS